MHKYQTLSLENRDCALFSDAGGLFTMNTVRRTVGQRNSFYKYLLGAYYVPGAMLDTARHQ